MPLIYILEDDNSVRELESYALQGNGYEVRGLIIQSLSMRNSERKNRILLLLT